MKGCLAKCGIFIDKFEKKTKNCQHLKRALIIANQCWQIHIKSDFLSTCRVKGVLLIYMWTRRNTGNHKRGLRAPKICFGVDVSQKLHNNLRWIEKVKLQWKPTSLWKINFMIARVLDCLQDFFAWGFVKK